ncbi:MAG: transcription antitermination factor NusB [Kiritimatiellaeota bacterium]|nr:transcription antitermination factor NusB [Kiritimatiellota bacterium]
MERRKHPHFRALGREFAMQFLFQFDVNQEDFDPTTLVRFFNQLDESETFENNREFRRAKKYARLLAEGIVEKIDVVDEKILPLLSKGWKWERISPVDKSILRLTTYELFFVDSVPPVVAINEALELTKIFAAPESKAFINAILDSIKNSVGK